MDFIKLTRHDGQPIYVNMEYVRVITVLRGETVLNVDGWDSNMSVKESPEAIMAIMELKERGKNA